jgi:hypothetical protein
MFLVCKEVMIIVKLMGGLGNQMFQYAAGRRLADRHKTQLKLDISFLKKKYVGSTPRFYELNNFNICNQIATNIEIAKFTGIGPNLWLKILLKIPWLAYLLTMNTRVYHERHFHFDPEVLTAPNHVYLDGYWQSGKYFKDIEDILRQDLSFQSPLVGRNLELSNLIKRADSVSLHIRRGDYVTDANMMAYHGVCDNEYYIKSVEKIQSAVKSPYFFVFSNDSLWVREEISLPSPMTIVEHNSPDQGIEDLRLMSMCRHNIIANSSFSWWGAWLNTNPGKIVIAPDKWFNSTSLNTKDLIPDQWIKI